MENKILWERGNLQLYGSGYSGVIFLRQGSMKPMRCPPISELMGYLHERYGLSDAERREIYQCCTLYLATAPKPPGLSDTVSQLPNELRDTVLKDIEIYLKEADIYTKENMRRAEESRVGELTDILDVGKYFPEYEDPEIELGSNLNYGKEVLSEKRREKGVQMGSQFELFVANLGDYVEGNLKGDYLSLPVSEEELRTFLKERASVRAESEELLIMDSSIPVEMAYLRDRIGEYTNLTDLNLLAHLLEKQEVNHEAVELYLSAYENLGFMQVGNLILQNEEIPFSQYEFQGGEDSSILDQLNEEEKYGYTATTASGAYNTLEELHLTDYVDYEAIGRDAVLNRDVVLGETGYLDVREAADTPDLECYSQEELYEIAGLKSKTIGELLNTEVEKTPEPEQMPKL